MNRRRTFFLGLCAGLIVTSAMAHDGVKNPAVMRWMTTMSDIGLITKNLTAMAKGKVEFDRSQVRANARALADHAAKIPAGFEIKELDPKSEASPAIWDDFAGFTALSNDLEHAADKAARARTKARLNDAMAEIGETCRACHKAFRN